MLAQLRQRLTHFGKAKLENKDITEDPIMLHRNQQSGFSLVELMIVVGIIGLLSALAVPRFQTFQARAKQAEAKTNLAQVYTLEEAYFLDNNTYAAAGLYNNTTCAASNPLGFAVKPCTAKSPLYYYAWTLPSATTFVASATDTNNLVVSASDCATKDLHLINEKREMDLAGGGAFNATSCVAY